MSPVASYFLGILTIVLILFIFWLISVNSPTFETLYENSICWKICDETQQSS